MNFPRLGDPKNYKGIDVGLDHIVETEITYASQFDLMPTWAQWAVVGVYTTIILSCATMLWLFK